MVLNVQTNYPSTRSYVLKLHRDAKLERGQVLGRLENIASGLHFDFSTVEELLACLARDAAASATDAQISSSGDAQGCGSPITRRPRSD